MRHITAGTGIHSTAALVHASPNTVQAVRDQDPNWRQEQSSTLKRFTRMITTDMVNMTPEQLAAVPLQQKAITLGVVLDKIAMLDGEPSQIVEVRHTADVSSLTAALSMSNEIDVTDSSHTVATVTPDSSDT